MKDARLAPMYTSGEGGVAKAWLAAADGPWNARFFGERGGDGYKADSAVVWNIDRVGDAGEMVGGADVLLCTRVCGVLCMDGVCPVMKSAVCDDDINEDVMYAAESCGGLPARDMTCTSTSCTCGALT